MAARLGYVIYWFALAIAILFIAGAIYFYWHNPNKPPFPYVWYVWRDKYFDTALPELILHFFAVITYLFGLACRYVLAGR